MVVLAASTAVWVFILLPLVIIWALGVVDIVRSHRSGWTTAGWLLAVILLPVIGSSPTGRAEADREGDQAGSSSRCGGAGPDPERRIGR